MHPEMEALMHNIRSWAESNPLWCMHAFLLIYTNQAALESINSHSIA